MDNMSVEALVDRLDDSKPAYTMTPSTTPTITSSFSSTNCFMITAPKVQSVLKINGGLQIHMPQAVPSKWQQFWQKVFFGFVWEKVNN